MDEEKKRPGVARRALSLRFAIFAGFILLAVVLLAILNTYPISLMRSQLIRAREAEMRSNFAALSSAVETS